MPVMAVVALSMAYASVQRLLHPVAIHFDEAILRHDEPVNIVPLNPRFEIRSGYISLREEGVFRRRPAAVTRSISRSFRAAQDRTPRPAARRSGSGIRNRGRW